MNKAKLEKLIMKYRKEKLNVSYHSESNDDFIQGYFQGYSDATKDIYADYIMQLVEIKKTKRWYPFRELFKKRGK